MDNVKVFELVVKTKEKLSEEEIEMAKEDFAWRLHGYSTTPPKCLHGCVMSIKTKNG